LGRKRIYSTEAERQRAYRSRQALEKRIPAPPIQTGGAGLKPTRITELEKSVRELIADCGAWLNLLPESLQASSDGSAMSSTLTMLAMGADLLADIVRDAEPTP